MSSTEPVKEPTPATATEPTTEPAEAPAEESTVPAAQVDGGGEVSNGSPLAETEYKVEVKLADMQADPNNPLYSAKSFEELSLQVPIV
jgi:ATP-dependent RNA helicase DDX19/DBP5